jgi:Uma2 family endonuclease
MEALNFMDYPIGSNSGQYTIEEVSQMESHAELVDGRLVVTDRTSVAHNNAVVEMATALRQFIRDNNGECRVFTENVALYCNELCDDEKNFFLPDVMVVCDKSGIKDDGVHIAPMFVAEITSVSTRKQDYVEKMPVYAKIGVQEYWIVDLQRKVVIQYFKDNDFIPEIGNNSLSAPIPVHSYPGLNIDLSNIDR